MRGLLHSIMQVSLCTFLSVVLAASCAAQKPSPEKPTAVTPAVLQTTEPIESENSSAEPGEPVPLDGVLVVVDFSGLAEARANELVEMLADSLLPKAAIVVVSPASRAQHPSRMAPYIVRASYIEMGSRFHISASVVSVEKGNIVGRATAKGEVAELQGSMVALAAEVDAAVAADISY